MPYRRATIGLALFSAVTAIAGGTELVIWRQGNRYVPIALLEKTPFQTFLIPGLLLGLLVGGASLWCAILAWRRSTYAIDGTLFAGATLALWIVSEVALLRSIHPLHVFFGILGLAILLLGLLAALRLAHPRHRWVIIVTLAEAVGFLAPAVTGVLTSVAEIAEGSRVLGLVGAGFFEGLVLGAGQAFAFTLPVRRGRYALLTAVSASFVWAVVMSTMQLAKVDAVPAVVVVATGVVAGVLALVAIGFAQWLELRHHTMNARPWIAWTALAWAAALPFSFAPSPLVDAATPVSSHVALWSSAGLLMAYVMALVTWQGARRLKAR